MIIKAKSETPHTQGILEALERHEQRRQKILSYVEDAHRVEPIKALFPSLIERIGIGYLEYHEICGVLITVNLEMYDQVLPILKWLSDHGYKMSKAGPEDFVELRRRTWNFGNVNVMGFFRGEKCQYVKVGEKVVDVMKLKCERATK